MSHSQPHRKQWVAYLRVSTPGQAEQELSIPAQRHALTTYARNKGRMIAREYVDEGCSANRNAGDRRPMFRRMVQEVMEPSSEVCTILIHHSSRFSRNATHARVVKGRLRRIGVEVVSISQETNDDPMGHLIEGIFECIDQYESELNGMRTTAAMREAVRQGFFPGSAAPYGFQRLRVEVKPNVFRSVLIPEPEEADMVRRIFELYVSTGGAKSVARVLNQEGCRYRRDRLWSKDLILKILDDEAAVGTYYWGRHDMHGRLRERNEWLPLTVAPIVDRERFDFVRKLRVARRPQARSGRTGTTPSLLRGLVFCAKCGANYQVESSGKRTATGEYKYRYYNCRKNCRIGREACEGGRIPMGKLDQALLQHLADSVCSESRSHALLQLLTNGALTQNDQGRREHLALAVDDLQRRIEDWQKLLGGSEAHRELACRKLEELRKYQEELEIEARQPERSRIDSVHLLERRQLQAAWRQLILDGGSVARNYLHLLVGRVEIDGTRVCIIGREVKK